MAVSNDFSAYLKGLYGFVKCTLRMNLVFLLLALPQWMLLSAFAWDKHLLNALAYFVASIVMLSSLQKWESLKYHPAYSYLTVVCCYELITLGLGRFMMNIDVEELMQLMAISLLTSVVICLMFFCIIISYCLPNRYKLAPLVGLGLVTLFAVLVVGTTFNWPFWLDFTMFLLLISVLTITAVPDFISFHNHQALRRVDALMLGFVLYVNYGLVLLACVICYQRFQRHAIGGTKGGWHA